MNEITIFVFNEMTNYFYNASFKKGKKLQLY